MRYVDPLMPFLRAGLQNHEAYQVCAAAVGVVGDLSRSIEAKLQPYCDGIVNLLGANLTNAHLDKSVKPPILSVFGDIALAIGLQFERYVPTVMAMLDQASKTQIDTEDEDLAEYANSLRQGILESYTGILQGLNEREGADQPQLQQLLGPFSQNILRFVHELAQESLKSAQTASGAITLAVEKAAVGVLGDLVYVLGAPVKQQLAPYRAHFQPLFDACTRTGDQDTIALANWAHGHVHAA